MGFFVGAMVGVAVGALVDVDAMGFFVGAMVGVAVGASVGASVGVAVGGSVAIDDRSKPNSTGEWSEQRAGDCPSK
jgi:hypothetical protein